MSNEITIYFGVRGEDPGVYSNLSISDISWPCDVKEFDTYEKAHAYAFAQDVSLFPDEKNEQSYIPKPGCICSTCSNLVGSIYCQCKEK